MGVAFYVKDEVDNKPFSYLPKNMPRCHNYHPKDIAINEESARLNKSASSKDPILTGLLVFIIIILFLSIAYYLFKKRNFSISYNVFN